jgi:S-disulfanyl-L-cysteine oxidoreductase SoxD
MKKAALLVCFSLVACGGSAPPPAEPSAPAPEAPAASPPPETAPAPVPTDAAALPATTTPAPTASAFAEQAKAGAALYATHCGSCHGDHGNDGKAPPVVGLKQGALPLAPPKKAKLRTMPFKTVADVAAFVVKTMPPKAPGSLSAEDYYAILAFDLQANGIDLGDKKLDAALAATLEIPR